MSVCDLGNLTLETLLEVLLWLQVVTADIDERAIGDRTSNPEALVLQLARAKAAAIFKKLGSLQGKALLITCDQVVVHDGKILEKPTSVEEVRHVRNMLFVSIFLLSHC